MERRNFYCPWFVCLAGLCASVVKKKKCGLFWSEWAVVVRMPCQPVALLGRNAHTHIYTHTNTDAQRHSAVYTEALVVCGRHPELQPTPVCQEESLCSWGGPSQQTKQGKKSFSCVTWKELKTFPWHRLWNNKNSLRYTVSCIQVLTWWLLWNCLEHIIKFTVLY